MTDGVLATSLHGAAVVGLFAAILLAAVDIAYRLGEGGWEELAALLLAVAFLAPFSLLYLAVS